MKVLILGASGYLGLPTAQAFVRAGHVVYGQTRSEEKRKLLEGEEIIPVIADPLTSASWSAIAEQADVIVDCSGGNSRILNASVFETALAAAKKARGNGALFPRLTYVAISGTWVHGDKRGPGSLTSERAAIATGDSNRVSWRAEHEQRVLSAKELDGIVVRPAILYGRSGAKITGGLLSAARKASADGEVFEWPAREGDRWALGHVDDAADLICRVAEAAPICKGQIFEAANDYSESVDDILNAVRDVSGTAGWKYREAANPFEANFATTTNLRPDLARVLVGWHPRRPSFVDGIKVYYDACKALTE